MPKAKLAEFRVSEDALVKWAASMAPSHFVAGQKVDVVGTSQGKGFAGAMKRHNFGGLKKRITWCVCITPFARFDRSVSRSRQSFQRQENGWSDG